MRKKNKASAGARAGEGGAVTLKDSALSIAHTGVWITADSRLYTFTPRGLAAVRAALAKEREGTS